jgi:glucokinase
MSKAGQGIYVGVDVGGTKIGLNAIDAQRRPVAAHWVQVASETHRGPRDTVRQIVVGVVELLRKRNIESDAVLGVGLDSPGPASINGKIEKSANMHADWEGFELRQQAEKALSAAYNRQIPVSYENDCNAAALWESFVGCPEGNEVMALLAPGTGLGGGIVVNGQLLRGSRGMGAELGHIEIVHEPFIEGWQPQCGCGQTYCAEAYTSLAALAKILPLALAQPRYKDHPLHKSTAATAEETWRLRAYQVRALAADGDELCGTIFDWQSRALARLCRQVADAIDPTRIVIGGGFIEGGPHLTDRIMSTIRQTFASLSFKKHAAEVQFEVARAADQAGCLGAALSAWQAGQR